MPKRKNKLSKFLSIFLAAVFLLSPFSFVPARLNQITARNSEIVFPFNLDKINTIDEGFGGIHWWRKGDDIEIDGAVVVKRGTMLAIEPGTTVKFRRNEGEVAPFIYIESGAMIMAIGNESEKVVFTSDQEDSHYSIIIEGTNKSDSYSAYMRYTEISKAGGDYEIETPVQALSPFSSGKAIAEDSTETITDRRYPIRHFGGTVEMENCRFHDNNSADFYVSEMEIDPDKLSEADYNLISIVNSNFENNQSGIAVRDDHYCGAAGDYPAGSCEKTLILKNNYYGKKTGPYLIKKSYDYYLEHQNEFILNEQFGAKIIGENTLFNGVRTKPLIADPAIIIPGIMGSEERYTGAISRWELDPILHTYDDLRESFQKNGYEKNINLFEFPYQWRNSNVITAEKLGEKIDEIKEETMLSYVDLIAHSMGGLVARQYIQSNDYERGIDQLITLGTPHRGSPEAYLKWEAAEGFFRFVGLAQKHHFRMEAWHSGYWSLFEYMREKVASVSELLPDYDYLEEGGETREYPEDYPRNEFLENLNKNNLDKLDQIRFTKIAGNIKQESTINKIKVTGESDGDKWEHGKPENFNDTTTDQGLIFGKGDETVPFESAIGTKKGKVIELDSTHSDLPTKAQCEVFHLLSGEKACFYQNEIDIPNFLMFNLFSPVDIQIIDPEGNVVGKDFENDEEKNEIDLAFYSGFETENEFVTIPNPKDGEYTIKMEGTGSGEFRVEAVLLGENEDGEEYEHELETFSGVAEEGAMETKKIEIDIQRIINPDEDDGGEDGSEDGDQDDDNGEPDPSDNEKDDGEDSDKENPQEIGLLGEKINNKNNSEESETKNKEKDNEEEDEEENEDEDKNESEKSSKTNENDGLISREEPVALSPAVSDFQEFQENNSQKKSIRDHEDEFSSTEVLGESKEDSGSFFNRDAYGKMMAIFAIIIIILLAASVAFWKIKFRPISKED